MKNTTITKKKKERSTKLIENDIENCDGQH